MPLNPTRSSHRLARHCVALAVLSLTLAAHGQAVQVHVTESPLDQALAQLAQQAGVRLSASPELLRGLQATPVNGAMTLDAALLAVLRGTGLQGRVVDGTLVVETARAGSDVTLPPVRVTAPREQAAGPVRGYAARRSATGTKTDTPLVETPQTVAVVTADQMATLKSQNLGDALAYTSGIRSDTGYGNSFDVFYSRGFRISDTQGNVYRDGLKLGSLGWATGQQEPYGLERVELLKGAASVLYGAAAPGGVLNTVSKRPTPDARREINVELGNFDHRLLSADLGGALGEGSDWSWRLVSLVRNDNTHVDYIPNDSRYIAPSLKWQPSAGTALTLMAHHQHRRSAYYYPLPAEGTLHASPRGVLPRVRFIGEPGFDRQTTEQSSAGYLFEHKFSDTTRLQHGLRYLKSTQRIRFTGLDLEVGSDSGVYTRLANDEREFTEGISTDTFVEHRMAFGSTQHTLLAGTDLSRFKPETEWSEGPLASLDVFEPVYGAQPGPMTLQATRNVATRAGIYLQDQIKHDRWVVLLGARQDWVRNRAGALYGEPAWRTETEQAATGRAGVVYLGPYGLAPFASYSESFEPQNGSDASGRRFRPTTGEQFELGIRWEPVPRGLMFTASIYELTQDNVMSRSPAGVREQVGQVRARGAELEAKGSLGRHANLVASYAYTDARTTRSLDPALLGMHQADVPYHQASMWLDGSLGAWALIGVQGGLGLRYTGSTIDVRGTNAKVPGHTVADAMLSYEVARWRYALNVGNLTDETTLSCDFGSCTYGEGRRVTGTVSYRW